MDGGGYPNNPRNPQPDTSSEKGKASASSRGVTRNEAIGMERNRREKMGEFYATLQSFVPDLFPKATRARIIDETIAYIKQLEELIESMESKKKAKQAAATSVHPVPSQTLRSSSVDITVSGKTAFFGIHSRSRPGLVTHILAVFERNKAEVLASTVTCHGGNINLTVTALAGEDGVVERLRVDLLSILS